MNFFASNLRHLRKKLKLSQTELSGKLSIKQNSLSNYEKGKSSPDLDTIIQLIKIFDISSDDFFFRDLTAETIEGEIPKEKKKMNSSDKEVPVNIQEFERMREELDLLRKNDSINSPLIESVKNRTFDLRLELRELKKEVDKLKADKNKKQK